MKKKNIVAVALAGTAIALLLTACGKKGSTQQKETADNQTTTKVQDVTGKQETDENEEKGENDANPDIDEEETTKESVTNVDAEPETQKKEYTYTDLEVTRYAKMDVNVRDLPSVDGKQLGVLKKFQKVLTTGTCNETGWYRISYNGGVGYVSGAYLVAENELDTSGSLEEEPTASNVPDVSADDILGVWDCEGTDDGSGVFTGRSSYTNELFRYGLTVPKTANVFGMDFLMSMSVEGIVKINQVRVGDEKGISISVSAYTSYQEYDVSSEVAFIQARQAKWGQGNYQYSQIDTVAVGRNTYYYVEERNSSGETNIYLVKKFDSHMLEIMFGAQQDIDLKADCLKYLN